MNELQRQTLQEKSKRILMAIVPLLFAVSLFSPRLGLSHGENKPGPNGGHIRMPGAFHTELKEAAPGKYEVYLLDVSLKGTPTDGWSLEAQLNRKSTLPQSLKCQRRKQSYLCEVPESWKIAQGDEITVKASRKNQPGATAVYLLPLSFDPSGQTYVR